ncbi:hypothetical protein [Agrobacterium sp. B1(2019)]|uniref:hypothetical protein n=1 Tax=Agrobacterium sp. B1(2019) TaxID=2607032 RepID=UPI0011EC5D9C|nr:hypothetical protein [Agrobacterium sp. B1(2019)]TZG34684.1 hypothetical protein AGR1_18555 [Agrobacterium sp. B1(2019)]
MGTPISFRLFHHWLATGKTGVAIQLAMIGKLRFYSQTGLNSQAAREQIKGNSGVFQPASAFLLPQVSVYDRPIRPLPRLF